MARKSVLAGGWHRGIMEGRDERRMSTTATTKADDAKRKEHAPLFFCRPFVVIMHCPSQSKLLYQYLASLDDDTTLLIEPAAIAQMNYAPPTLARVVKP